MIFLLPLVYTDEATACIPHRGPVPRGRRGQPPRVPGPEQLRGGGGRPLGGDQPLPVLLAGAGPPPQRPAGGPGQAASTQSEQWGTVVWYLGRVQISTRSRARPAPVRTVRGPTSRSSALRNPCKTRRTRTVSGVGLKQYLRLVGITAGCVIPDKMPKCRSSEFIGS